MANLVTPGYKKNVLINQILPPIAERIIEFKGLNRRTVAAEGEMPDMWNLTSDDYPLLRPRKPRGTMRLPQGVERPIQLMAKFEKIAMLASVNGEVSFYYDGTLVNEVQGLSEGTRMVGINTKICFFPENKYIEVTQEDGIKRGTFAGLDTKFDNTAPGATALTISIGMDAATMTFPEAQDFVYDDAVTFKGTLTYTGGSSSIETSVVVETVSDDNRTITVMPDAFLDVTSQGITSVRFTGTIERSMPKLDHVIEWNNRLWGCSNADNTVYASKLGDPKNWQYFQGTNLDSYYAQQGTDGEWTGIGLFSNHLLCFKQESICRVYGSAPSNYQVQNVEAFGVESGSRQSVVTINDTVFYKSKIGIMAYTGDIPVCISDGFNCEFKDVIAGTEKRKYYASIHTKHGYELMVFDVGKGVWHKEDSTRFRGCATIGDRLYFIEHDGDVLKCSESLPCSKWLVVGAENPKGRVGIINPIVAEENADDLEWRAVFGPFDEYIEEHKIYSKLALRIITRGSTENELATEWLEPITTEDDEVLELDRYLNVYISIDEGDWELVESYLPPKTEGGFIPIIPRRCDRYSIKIEAKGNYEIKSLTRRVRQGTFGRL